jgi:hypothetical protein
LRIAILLGLLLLTSCTSPMWIAQEHEHFEYKGFDVHVGNHWQVLKNCGVPLPILGCVYVESKQAWTVPNTYIMAHECWHIDNFTAGNSEADEVGLDLLAAFSGFNEIATLATSVVPFEATCGEGSTVARNYDECMAAATHGNDEARCDYVYQILQPGESKLYGEYAIAGVKQ